MSGRNFKVRLAITKGDICLRLVNEKALETLKLVTVEANDEAYKFGPKILEAVRSLQEPCDDDGYIKMSLETMEIIKTEVNEELEKLKLEFDPLHYEYTSSGLSMRKLDIYEVLKEMKFDLEDTLREIANFKEVEECQ